MVVGPIDSTVAPSSEPAAVASEKADERAKATLVAASAAAATVAVSSTEAGVSSTLTAESANRPSPEGAAMREQEGIQAQGEADF